MDNPNRPDPNRTHTEACDCNWLRIARNRHRWDCPLTPVWEEVVRAGYIPSAYFGGVAVPDSGGEQ